MESVLRALAETFFPCSSNTGHVQAQNVEYLRLNGADCPQLIPQVLRVIDVQLYGPSKTRIKLLIALLAYRLPTLLLAGRYCLCGRWPFVLSLPEMPVAQRHAALMSWARSPLPDLRQAYKGIKAIFAAVLFSHIDPTTGTNPTFKALGFVPGNAFQDTAVGPPPPGAAEQEEVLASATVDMPQVLHTLGSAAAVQEYLSKRGFSTVPTAAAGQDSSTTGSSSSSDAGSIHLYYDAVIVGSGAGGGVTAAVLAAAGMRVLVLEKSSWVRSKDMSWLEHEAFEQMYERGGFMITDDGALVMLAGSTLGGGTKINWTASLKPPTHVRQEWASAPHGLIHLGPGSAAFDDALDKVCSRLGVGTGTTPSGPNTKLTQGLQALGEHVEEYPRNCLSKTCSAYCNMGCRSGHKQSSEVWLLDAVRAGAQVLTGMHAERVLLQACQGASACGTRRQKATGVQAAINSRSSSSSQAASSSQAVRVVVHAPVVVSSCGSIHTPALLLRSGITVGGNVGSNLRLHPATGTVGIFPRSAQQAAAGQGAVQMYKGVSMGVFSRAAANWEAGGYGALLSVPAVQPGLLAAIVPDHSLGCLKDTVLTLQDASLTVLFTRDSSGGRVRIDSEGRPVVSYWPCPTTRSHLMEGIIMSARALAAAGATRVIIPNAVEPWDLTLNPDDPPERRQQQLEGLIQRIRAVGVRKYDIPLFSAHQMGSCRMGAARESSACDPHGECWDVAGLFIGDGSAFPTPSGVNPMITIYGLAYLTALGIASRWRRRAAA